MFHRRCIKKSLGSLILRNKILYLPLRNPLSSWDLAYGLCPQVCPPDNQPTKQYKKNKKTNQTLCQLTCFSSGHDEVPQPGGHPGDEVTQHGLESVSMEQETEGGKNGQEVTKAVFAKANYLS